LDIDRKHLFQIFISFIGLPIFIALPWNDWSYLNHEQINHFSLQPYSIGLIIILGIYICITSIKRCNIARKKILDPALSELYKYIHRSIIFASLSIFPLVGMFIYYMAEETYLPIINFICITLFCSRFAIGIFLSIIGFYIALTIPKSLLKKHYQNTFPCGISLKMKTDYNEIQEKLKKALF